MSRSADEHRRHSPRSVRCAVVTVSDTRKREADTGGDAIAELLVKAGHEVVGREIVPDEPVAIRALVDRLVREGAAEAVLVTGGTGIAPRDQTFETLSALLTKTLPGYGELFRMLSYQEIGPAAMLSRAVGGLVQSVVVLSMPGSPAAVELAMQKLILPELGHLVYEAHK
jgi:molybdenum cofactor biosynthesis protein B